MSDQRKFLKPAEGRTVRREDTGAPWPEAGDWTDDSIFVRRRLADGDLVLATAPAEAEPEPVAAQPEADPAGGEPTPKPFKSLKSDK